MKSLLLALQFLTRLPIRIKAVEPTDLARSMIWFPLVGLVIGGVIGFIALLALMFQVPSEITAALIVSGFIILTGGLHLDGLSDMTDGFYAGKNKEEILNIMKDPHIGVMGTLAIIVVLILKYSILVNFCKEYIRQINLPNPGDCMGVYIGRTIRFLSYLVVIPVISRWGMVLASASSPYAIASGTAQPFIESLKPIHWIMATIITYCVAIGLLGVYGFVLSMMALLAVIISVIYIRPRIGGITGDTLGAINEIIETVVLFGAYLIYRV